MIKYIPLFEEFTEFNNDLESLFENTIYEKDNFTDIELSLLEESYNDKFDIYFKDFIINDLPISYLNEKVGENKTRKYIRVSIKKFFHSLKNKYFAKSESLKAKYGTSIKKEKDPIKKKNLIKDLNQKLTDLKSWYDKLFKKTKDKEIKAIA